MQLIENVPFDFWERNDECVVLLIGQCVVVEDEIANGHYVKNQEEVEEEMMMIWMMIWMM